MTCHHCGHLASPHPDPVYAGIAPAMLNDGAGDRKPDSLGGQVQGVAVHGDRYAIDAVFPSSGNAGDISGEARG